MAGRFDEISRAIGSLEATVDELRRRVDENCELQARRHADTAAILREFAARLDLQAEAAAIIRSPTPTFERLQSRLATWASIGFAVAVLASWVFEAAIKWAVERLLAHF